MEDKQGAQYLISGSVQGVFFRATTKEKAKSIGVTGWVRNRPDGRVEVLAFGSIEQLVELEAWLSHGPEGASVEAVVKEPAPWEAHEGFKIKYF